MKIEELLNNPSFLKAVDETTPQQKFDVACAYLNHVLYYSEDEIKKFITTGHDPTNHRFIKSYLDFEAIDKFWNKINEIYLGKLANKDHIDKMDKSEIVGKYLHVVGKIFRAERDRIPPFLEKVLGWQKYYQPNVELELHAIMIQALFDNMKETRQKNESAFSNLLKESPKREIPIFAHQMYDCF